MSNQENAQVKPEEKKAKFSWSNFLKNYNTNGILVTFGVIGILGILIYAICSSLCLIADLFLIAIASTIFGAMGGFLFGIPKMGKVKSDGQTRPNTNLE